MNDRNATGTLNEDVDSNRSEHATRPHRVRPTRIAPRKLSRTTKALMASRFPGSVC
jgi:hypothetical protein